MTGGDMEQGGTYHARMEPPVDFVPQRVVSLVPSLTESLFDLDLGDRLVAVSSNCVRPMDRVEYLLRVGESRTPDVERIAALRPDLVLMNADENRQQDVEAVQAAGIPVWVTGPRTVFDALNVLWALMDVFDHAVMVPRVREIERAYDYSLAASLAGAPVRVFVPVWRDPWLTFDAATFAHDLLRVCGGLPVFAADAGALDSESVDSVPEALRGAHFLPVTLADVEAAQPDVVLLPDVPYAFSDADRDQIARLDIPAARGGRIHSIDGSLLFWHGTRIAYALRDLPGLLA